MHVLWAGPDWGHPQRGSSTHVDGFMLAVAGNLSTQFRSVRFRVLDVGMIWPFPLLG